MLSFFREQYFNRQIKAIFFSMALLISACGGQIKSTPITEVDLGQQFRSFVNKGGLESLLRRQLKKFNSKTDTNRIISTIKNDSRRRRQLLNLLIELYGLEDKYHLEDEESSDIIAIYTRTNADRDYFYGDFKKGDVLIYSIKLELKKKEEQLALLEKVEALIGGKFGWAVNFRRIISRGAYDLSKKGHFERMFDAFEDSFTILYKLENKDEALQGLKDLHSLARRMHNLYSDSDLAFPKTQEYLLNLIINLGGTIERLKR